MIMTQIPTGLVAAVQLVLCLTTVNAQSSCQNAAPSGKIKPSIASGYQYAVVATGLSSPRGIQFDSAGNLLVIEARKALSIHQVQQNGDSCVQLTNSKSLIEDKDVRSMHTH